MKLHNVERNLVIWTIVTIICSAFSFRVAYQEGFNVVAMLTGILIVILGYTFASSTSFYQNIKNNKKYFNRALKISFGIKILNALMCLPFDYKSPMSNFVFIYIVDAYLGAASLNITRFIFGIKTANIRGSSFKEFLPTLTTTLIEAFLMSLFILFIAFLIWVVIRIWLLIFKKRKNAS